MKTGAVQLAFLRVFVGLLFVCAPFVSFGQEQLQDVVYLKNGSIIRGDIIEQIPNQTIKVRTTDGSVFVYAMTEIEKITKERRIALPGSLLRKPLGSFAVSVNPLGFLQIGPAVQTEFRVAPAITFGPYVRFLGLGLVTHALADYDALNTSSLALGGAVKYFFGEPDVQSRFVGGLMFEYGFGGGTNENDVYVNNAYVQGNYDFAYLGFGTTFGYRWRFESPLFIGLGVMAGAATETVDKRSSPSPKDYPKRTYFIGMIEFTIGYEK